MDREYRWAHWDDPHIANTARVHFGSENLTASGFQRGHGYEATWSVETGEEFITRLVNAHVHGDGWSRNLELTRSVNGRWTSNASASGNQPADLAAPGITPDVDLSGALDCDLGLCPLTNTMPIRRLKLLEDAVPNTALIMAWIDMPSLRVIASDQYYASIDSATVSYASGTRGVNVQLTVDPDGVVVEYPGMARRV